MTTWLKNDIKNLDLTSKLNWFDVYNYGLLTDRGINIKNMSTDEIFVHNEKNKEDYLVYLESLVTDNNFMFYSILYKNDTIVSVCRVIKNNDKFFIEGLETHRDYRTLGYGKNVLKNTILEAKKIDIKELYSVIRIKNTNSIKTHEKNGFKVIKKDDINVLMLLDVFRFEKILLFNEWAGNYNTSVRKSEEVNEYPFSGYFKIKREIFDIVTHNDTGNVLEMGIGTGEIIKPLYDLGYNITGVDFSSNMINISKELMPKAEYIKSDFINSLPQLKQKRYDVIIFSYSIHHLTRLNQLSILADLFNILSSNGIIIIGDVITLTENEMDNLKVQYGSIWDDEENYPIYDIYNNSHLSDKFKIKFKRITHCSGIIEMSKK